MESSPVALPALKFDDLLCSKYLSTSHGQPGLALDGYITPDWLVFTYWVSVPPGLY